jgi:hypothetical protein
MFGRLVERAKAGLLGFSSGTIGHLFRQNADGEITRWPCVELSLTPTPSSPDAKVYTVKASDGIAHLALVGISAPALKSLLRTPIDSPEAAVMAVENDLALARMRLADSQAAENAYIDWLRTDNELATAIERSA